MISQKIVEAINGQIKEEFYSAYLYLALAAHYEAAHLKGFYQWLMAQYEEEMQHAIKFYNYLLERDGKIELLQIDKPPTDFPPPHEAFKLAYAHEKKTTGLINDLYHLAQTEKDPAFEQFLRWFIEEQVEEEEGTLAIVGKLEKIGKDPTGLFMLDGQLGQQKEAGKSE